LTETYKYAVGTLEGNVFTVIVRTTPSRDNPEEFSVQLVVNEKVEVIRIDNAEGKGPHIHRLYRRDEPEESFDGGVWEAVAELQEKNWRTYAQSYLQSR